MGRLEGRGHGGAGGLGVAAGRLQRRGGMAGPAAASPPTGAGAGPPPSPCPAVCGLRSSSSPCLRGPEPGTPQAGRRRGGPRCRCWPPPVGRAALAALPAPSAPQHLPGAGECCPAPRGRPAEDAPAGGRAERSAQLDPSLQLQVPAPPPPATNREASPAPPRLPIGCRGCPSGQHSWTGRHGSPVGLDGAHPPGAARLGVGPGHPLPVVGRKRSRGICRAERWRRG